MLNSLILNLNQILKRYLSNKTLKYNEDHPQAAIATGEPSILAAMIGLDCLDNFKFFGIIKRIKALVSIDPGITLNIIDRDMQESWGLWWILDTSKTFPIQTPSHYSTQGDCA